MRLNLRLTGTTEPLGFNHLHFLTGCIHKWLGKNALHDGLSLYSFGWLQGAVAKNGHPGFPGGHLTFRRGATWRISFYDDAAAKRLLDGIMREPEVCAGMRVFEAREQPTPALSGCYRFKTDGGPVLARRTRADGSREYLLAGDDQADEALTRVLRRKLEEAGFTGEHLEATAQFDRMYDGARPKLIEIKGTKHKGSLCPVVVTGTPEAVRFAWTVGAGDLTGSGFGALR